MINSKHISLILLITFITLFLALIVYSSVKGSVEKTIDNEVWKIYVVRDRIPLWEGECYHRKSKNYEPLKLMTYRDYNLGSKKKFNIKKTFLNDEINPKNNIRIALKPILYECKTEPYLRKSHLVFRSRLIP